MPKIIIVILCLGLFSGCATIPEEQCAKVDWHNLGVQDGLAGYSAANRLARHREACFGVKIVPDEKRYLQGHQIGLVEYCHPENAVRQGLAGRLYSNVCDQRFGNIYHAAYAVYSLKQQINSNLSRVSGKEDELRDEKSAKRRDRLRSEIRELDRQRETLRNELYSAERELERLRKSFSSYR